MFPLKTVLVFCGSPNPSVSVVGKALFLEIYRLTLRDRYRKASLATIHQWSPNDSKSALGELSGQLLPELLSTGHSHLPEPRRAQIQKNSLEQLGAAQKSTVQQLRDPGNPRCPNITSARALLPAPARILRSLQM